MNGIPVAPGRREKVRLVLFPEKLMRHLPTTRALCTVAFAALATACSGGGTSPSGEAQLSVNLATRAAAAAAAAGAALSTLTAPETYTDASGNTLVLDRVQLVLREVELENESHQGECEVATGDDDCAEVEIGPFLVDLPLGTPGAARIISATVPAGTYDEVKFKIREPDDDASDAAFRAEHPDFADISVKAEGTYNGAPFTLVSDLEAELELELAPPLVVGDAATTDLTLFADLNAWFRTAGGDLFDPATANQGGPNRELLAQNVHGSFNAFEDDDHDGSDDHGSDDHGGLGGDDD
jgi:hypothetical protein